MMKKTDTHTCIYRAHYIIIYFSTAHYLQCRMFLFTQTLSNTAAQNTPRCRIPRADNYCNTIEQSNNMERLENYSNDQAKQHVSKIMTKTLLVRM